MRTKNTQFVDIFPE